MSHTAAAAAGQRADRAVVTGARFHCSGSRRGKPVSKSDAARLQDERRRVHPQADAIERVVRLWNELRERRTAPAAKHALVADIYAALRGHVAELAMRHDTSRAVQGCIKFGDAQQRELMCRELQGKCLDFAKAKALG